MNLTFNGCFIAFNVVSRPVSFREFDKREWFSSTNDNSLWVQWGLKPLNANEATFLMLKSIFFPWHADEWISAWQSVFKVFQNESHQFSTSYVFPWIKWMNGERCWQLHVTLLLCRRPRNVCSSAATAVEIKTCYHGCQYNAWPLSELSKLKAAAK